MEQANYATQSLKDTHSTVIAMKAGVKQMQKEFKKINISEIDVSSQTIIRMAPPMYLNWDLILYLSHPQRIFKMTWQICLKCQKKFKKH